MRVYGRLGRLEVGDGLPVRVAGVLNVSPESFYKGSISLTDDDIGKAVLKMASEGCDLIDIGGRSTAPYLITEISVDEEVRRVVKAVTIAEELSNIPISVDTFRAKVAEEALKRGAEVINDVTGLRGDKEMLRVIKDYQPSLIVCASEAGIESKTGRDAIDVVKSSLQKTLGMLNSIDYDLSKVVVDPCIGFFRNQELPWYVWDLNVLANLISLRSLGRPIAVGISRKSFIGVITNREKPEDRLYGSLALTAVAVLNGAHLIRTHDVLPTKDAIKAIEGFKVHSIKLSINYG
ncbi:MAG: dihydropteroate synthase [Sulfolobales archaeon]|nr:dihydropteroate synthase [Sulfolobales archaeon]MDW7969233.1 dihydropteroate synthase [Sulfolobales archaeon]